jgi:hypothetical protein
MELWRFMKVFTVLVLIIRGSGLTSDPTVYTRAIRDNSSQPHRLPTLAYWYDQTLPFPRLSL